MIGVGHEQNPHRVLDDILLSELLEQLQHVGRDVRILVAQQAQQVRQRLRMRMRRTTSASVCMGWIATKWQPP